MTFGVLFGVAFSQHSCVLATDQIFINVVTFVIIPRFDFIFAVDLVQHGVLIYANRKTCCVDQTCAFFPVGQMVFFELSGIIAVRITFHVVDRAAPFAVIFGAVYAAYLAAYDLFCFFRIASHRFTSLAPGADLSALARDYLHIFCCFGIVDSAIYIDDLTVLYDLAFTAAHRDRTFRCVHIVSAVRIDIFSRVAVFRRGSYRFAF